MKHQYRMYGWTGSHFTAKLRGYLNYKGLDYEEGRMWLYDLLVRIPLATGATAMPTLQTQTGEWLADTPLIIEALEQRHPENSIGIDTPRQRMAAMLLENWFDDSWLAVSVHTRWSYPENWDNLLRQEWGHSLLPLMPAFVGQWLAENVAKKPMSGSRHLLGVRPESMALLERWVLQHLDTLNAHFQQNDYLLGGRPTIGDYACLGTFYPHLNRDPWPRREWLDKRPDLQAWVERTHSGLAATGPLLADDEIPASLAPIFATIFNEFPDYIQKSVAGIKRYVEKRSATYGTVLPRVLQDVSYPMLDGEYTRMPFTYTIWRLQRMQRVYQALPIAQQERVCAWCAIMGRADIFTMDLGPALRREGLGAALA